MCDYRQVEFLASGEWLAGVDEALVRVNTEPPLASSRLDAVLDVCIAASVFVCRQNLLIYMPLALVMRKR